MDLTDVLRNVRRGMGLTQSELAQLLQVDQTAISQYENGKTTPGPATLSRLYRFAPEGREKQLLKDILTERFGDLPEGAEGQTHSVANLKRIARSIPPPSPEWTRLLKEVVLLGKQAPDVDESLIEMIRLYRLHHKHREVRKAFERALAWLEVELGLEPSQKSAGPRKRSAS